MDEKGGEVVRPHRFGPNLSRIGWGVVAFLLGQLIGRPALGAERVFLSYALFSRSVSVSALETYVREGQLTGDLISYARFLKPKQLLQLREGLQQKVDFSAIALSQFFYTPTGELLLDRVSRIIQPPLGRGSLYALRSALIQAANDPDGLTPLSLLRHYPNAQVVVNLAEGIGVVREVNRWVKQTEIVSQSIQAASAKAADSAPLSVPQVHRLIALKQKGPQSWQKLVLALQDASQKRLQYTDHVRKYTVDVYLPVAGQFHPVILISHGLNSDRQSYAYLAEYLASYGYAVAVPEHPGSSKQQIQALLDGRAGDVAEPSEFLDRPLDIQFVLDSLQGLSQEDGRFRDRLNLQQVGIIGQSFGGYTALVSAGAPLALAGLKQQCDKRLDSTLNLSLVLQCQALRLPVASYRLGDPRIKAAIAVNPIISGLLGPASLGQLQVPVMVVAGSADIVAPALPEQIQPFSALKIPQRYLVLIRNANHFSTIAPSVSTDSTLPKLPALDGPSPELAKTYLKVLSLIFMNTSLQRQEQDRLFLSAAGVAPLSRPPLPLSLVTALPDPK